MTEDDVFDRLRRCDYTEACIRYSIERIKLGSNPTQSEIADTIEPILRRLGWTLDSLSAYGIKLQKDTGIH